MRLVKMISLLLLIANTATFAQSTIQTQNYRWSGTIGTKNADVAFAIRDNVVICEIKGLAETPIYLFGYKNEDENITARSFSRNGVIEASIYARIVQGRLEGDYVSGSIKNFKLSPVTTPAAFDMNRHEHCYCSPFNKDVYYDFMPESSVGGHYSYDYTKDEGTGSVKIKDLGMKSISFNIECVGHGPNYNQAVANGTTTLKGNIARYNMKEVCEFVFDMVFCNDFMIVRPFSGTQGGCFGMNMTIVDVYKKLPAESSSLPSNNTQTDIVSHLWSDGSNFYRATLEKGALNFSGGSLHEGGAAFSLKKSQSDDTYILGTSTFGNDGINEISVNGKAGDKVVYKSFNGKLWLIVYDKRGNATDALTQTEDLKNLIEMNMVKYLFAGRYIGSDGKEFVFLPDRRVATGFSKQTNYTFEEEFETPFNTITFEKGKTFYIEPTGYGLDVYYSKYDENGANWNKGAKMASLRKASWTENGDDSNAKCKYSFASEEILMSGVLNLFSAKELKIMRNEIFARHGYIFKSTDMQNYFAMQKWYKPTSADVTKELTPIERVNVSLIDIMEKEKAAE